MLAERVTELTVWDSFSADLFVGVFGREKTFHVLEHEDEWVNLRDRLGEPAHKRVSIVSDRPRSS